MARITNVFKESVPKMRFLCKKYPGFGPWWGEWFANGWFDRLEQAMNGVDSILAIWENGGGYVGLERRIEGTMTAYCIGMFAPAETEIPDGFEAIDFPAIALGTCFITGKEQEVHDTSGCRTAVENAGMKIWQDSDGAVWSFENCLCPRYTTPDENGDITMDYCYFVES